MSRTHVATYRLQFREGLDFDSAAAIVPYLTELGISHLYASPIFTATHGSTHGYDVIDHQTLDPALGGAPGFKRLTEALQAAGLGLIIDIVPNHMAASPQNHWWWDVLEWGEASHYAKHFDIDWAAPRLILPVLGAPVAGVMAAGELGLAYEADLACFCLTYFDLKVPLTPTSYALILDRLDQSQLAASFAAASPQEIDELKARLRNTLSLAPDLAPLSNDIEFLNRLHDAQIWRLAYWRLGRDGLTYRRFFEITELVGVRVEDSRVFADVHRLSLELVTAGQVDGLRIDHVDGLTDPTDYLNRLRSLVSTSATVHVEKILEGPERLCPDWPIDGTTGYEFITCMAELLIDPSGEAVMDTAYAAFLAGRWPRVDPVQVKTIILTNNLAGELDVLMELLTRITVLDPAASDFGHDTLRRALVAFIAAFPVYRTYISGHTVSATDGAVLESAASDAERIPLLEDPRPIELLKGYLSRQVATELKEATQRFTTRFQQTTGAVMAKAIEDTLYYRDARLIGLNEVGGDPQRFGAPIEDFHQAMRRRREEQPLGLSTTATHDTKRGEDARARLYVLSERPDDWADIVSHLASEAAPLRQELEGGLAPSANLEWKIYQAICASWPAELRPNDTAGMTSFRQRVDEYLEKALREAKSRTTWTAPNAEYEAAVRAFATALLDSTTTLPADMARLFAPFWTAGALNGLVQTLLKVTAPGIPDIYQGTEHWDFSFVDPDNRRPVDFAARARQMAEIQDAHQLLADWRSGGIKQFLLARALKARATQPALFTDGDYQALRIEGSRAGQVVAYCRRLDSAWAITIAPVRASKGIHGDFPIVDPGYWEDTAVCAGPGMLSCQAIDAMTGRRTQITEKLMLSEVLARFPVTLLTNAPKD